MQRKLNKEHKSEEEEIKSAGITLDYDEIARKGSMSKEESLISKWYGIYGSRQSGNFMARIIVPGGSLSSAQVRLISHTAENYAQGKIAITTRQAIQLHWLKLPHLPHILRELAEEWLTTFHGCGDVNRNVTACPYAETCEYRRLNVRPYAQKTSETIAACRDLDNLPRKFKITYSGCGAGCAQPFINCIGAIGVEREISGEKKIGFKVVIGGGMGWKAFLAKELFSFVPQHLMVSLTRAIALLFRDYGDRFNRSKSRLKFVVHRLGIKKCREIIINNLKKEGISPEGLEISSFKETGKDYPDRPLTEINEKNLNGKANIGIRVPMGELNHTQFRQIAEFSETYANQRVYTTNRQNLMLSNIDPRKVEEVKNQIQKIGLFVDGIWGLPDIVPCVGTTYCPKAVGSTRSLYEKVMPIVTKEKFRSIQKSVLINITGCPNSCSPYRITDIGFRGARIREEMGSVEAFEVLLGGSQTSFGKKLGDFKTDDCPEVVERVLDVFMKVKKEGEALTDTVNRLGINYFWKAVYYEENEIPVS